MRQFKARYNLFILNGKLSIQRLKGSRQVKYATKGMILNYDSFNRHLIRLINSDYGKRATIDLSINDLFAWFEDLGERYENK